MTINQDRPCIAIIGAGMIGETLAKLWTRAGYPVVLSSRHPENLSDMAEVSGAETAVPEKAARLGDIVIVTISLKNIPALAEAIAPIVADKVVIDTNNPHPDRDGEVAQHARHDGQGSAQWFAGLFPGARVVKAFNTVYYRTLLERTNPEHPTVGIPLASDDHEAMAAVADLVRDAGFEPVAVGGLARAQDFDVGTPVYNSGAGAVELRRMLKI